jgi:RNA polymerase sigma factor (sigma-70 family)
VAALAATGAAPGQAIRRQERFERLEAVFATLSPDRRQVVTLALLEDLPIREVAARMGRSPDAASMLLLRALRQLKQAFGHTESLHLPPRALDGAPARDPAPRPGEAAT